MQLVGFAFKTPVILERHGQDCIALGLSEVSTKNVLLACQAGRSQNVRSSANLVTKNDYKKRADMYLLIFLLFGYMRTYS